MKLGISRNSFGGRRAFTLIELLVVIAIIALLAAILFPVFAQAREKARTATCQSNLKQLGIGILQYTQDYDEAYPLCWTGSFNGTSFNPIENLLDPYLKSAQIWKCPSRPSTGYSGNAVTSRSDYGYHAYLFGSDFSNSASNALSTRLSSIAAPAQELIMTDISNVIIPPSDWSLYFAAADWLRPQAWQDAGSSSGVYGWNDLPILGLPEYVNGPAGTWSITGSFQVNGIATTRHLGRTNVLYADGHASLPVVQRPLSGNHR